MPEIPGFHCENCGEDHDTVFLHSRCHPDAAAYVMLHKKGYVEAHCATCDRAFFRIYVGVNRVRSIFQQEAE